MEAVRGINIPMYTTLRRTVVAFTMVMDSDAEGVPSEFFDYFKVLMNTLSDCR